MSKPLEGKYMSFVKVGAKGQIVIPKECRELFNIEPGDTLLLLADINQGIALQKIEAFEAFETFTNEVFKGTKTKKKSEED